MSGTDTLEEKVKILDSHIEIQCANGNWNFDPYMHGLANGLILAQSVLTGEEPEFKEAPADGWLADKDAGDLVPEIALEEV